MGYKKNGKPQVPGTKTGQPVPKPKPGIGTNPPGKKPNPGGLPPMKGIPGGRPRKGK
jgi:hypothetical protein